MDPLVTQLILQDRKIAYAITDRDLIVVQASDPIGFLCAPLQTCVGRSLFELAPELVGSEAVLTDLLAGTLPRFELTRVNRETPQGQTFYLTIVGLPYRDATGHIVGLVHLVHDVTEMGSLEQRLAQHRNELRLLQRQLAHQNRELASANAELRRLDELKSMFVSVAAHELRTPLTAISGYVEVLLDEDLAPLSPEQREYLEIVGGGARRLLIISENLLDVTRIEAGRVELVMRPTDLAALIKAVMDELQSQFEGRDQHLTLRAPPHLPPVLCDQTRATQIFGNLLSNATRTGAGGAGLGLFITRSLVELHGGRIWFESELDRGSTFNVTLPVAALQSAAAPARAAEPVLKADNLRRIEGIGPKIAQVLQDAGIQTFAQLAAADVGRLEQILQDAQMTLADPATWPEQARLAAAGDWGGLEKLQDELQGGRRV